MFGLALIVGLLVVCVCGSSQRVRLVSVVSVVPAAAETTAIANAASAQLMTALSVVNAPAVTVRVIGTQIVALYVDVPTNQQNNLVNMTLADQIMIIYNDSQRGIVALRISPLYVAIIPASDVNTDTPVIQASASFAVQSTSQGYSVGDVVGAAIGTFVAVFMGIGIGYYCRHRKKSFAAVSSGSTSTNGGMTLNRRGQKTLALELGSGVEFSPFHMSNPLRSGGSSVDDSLSTSASTSV